MFKQSVLIAHKITSIVYHVKLLDKISGCWLVCRWKVIRTCMFFLLTDILQPWVERYWMRTYEKIINGIRVPNIITGYLHLPDIYWTKHTVEWSLYSSWVEPNCSWHYAWYVPHTDDKWTNCSNWNTYIWRDVWSFQEIFHLCLFMTNITFPIYPTSSLHWGGTADWIPSSWETMKHSSCLFNNMVVVVVVTQGSGAQPCSASAAMTLSTTYTELFRFQHCTRIVEQQSVRIMNH